MTKSESIMTGAACIAYGLLIVLMTTNWCVGVSDSVLLGLLAFGYIALIATICRILGSLPKGSK